MAEIKQKTDSKNKLKVIVLILLGLSILVYLTYDIIMTYYCKEEPNPKTFINKTIENPISIYWEDNVYPGFSKEDRELMIINYLNGKNLKTMALNGDDGKIYVYSVNENDYEKIIQNSIEQKNIYKKYQEYAKFVMQNEKVYTKDTMKYLDEFEKDILQSVEVNEWKSKSNTKERLKELQSYIKNEKNKAISLRLSENNIYELKKKALENSIPYQNFVQVLIHQFVTNKIKLDV